MTVSAPTKTTALVLGGADSLHRDITLYTGPVHGVVACNDAGTVWPYELDAWVSLHGRYFMQKNWLETRDIKGYSPAKRLYVHTSARRPIPDAAIETNFNFDGCSKSGSSGLFAAKVALQDLGFDNVVLCGIPLTPTPHFFDTEPWREESALNFRKTWLAIPPEFKSRIKSMSGWTRETFGEPKT
jgi:hypothetical protein